MEGESVQNIRETSRNFLYRHRKIQKDEETDVRRSLVDLGITQTDVCSIINKLKSKAAISAADLKLLQNALADDPKNIETLLNTHGAVRGLVKELTGHDVNKQCGACNCLCNIALVESKVCCTIAKAAGAYLVTTLDTLTTQLAVSSAWTLGNLAGSGPQACDVLIPQGALTKLCDMMQRDNEVQQAAVYALSHFAFVMKDDLRPVQLHKIIEALSKTELNVDSSQLLFIISCHKDFTVAILPEGYLHKIVDKFTVSIEHHLYICCATKSSTSALCNTNGNGNSLSSANGNTKCCELKYLIRVLSNLNNEVMYNDLISYFVNNNLVSNFRRLLEIEADESLLWLLGNMANYSGNSEFLNQLIVDRD